MMTAPALTTLTSLTTGAGIVPMIQFLEPARLWWLLLIPVVVVLYFALMARGKGSKMRKSSSLDMVIPRERTWVRHVAVGLAVLSLAALTVAFAKPKDTVLEERQRATIAIAIDISLSMGAEDVEPNRLAAAQEAAKEFVQSVPAKFNVALIAYAGTASTLVPPTTDRGPVIQAIDDLQLQSSTATGEGIYTALSAIEQAPPDPDDPDAPVPARIVLLSDGKQTLGRPSADAAEEAKAREVPIYTIAYGTENGYVEIDGRRERVPVDKYELSVIAKISGGKAYEADSAGDLKEVFEDIKSQVGKVEVFVEVTERYAGLGLLFAVLAAAGVISIAARWP